MSDTKQDFEKLIELNTEIKGCISSLERAVSANTLSQEKESDRYFKIIIALIAMVGGILGLKLNFPQTASGIGIAYYRVSASIDWSETFVNFSRYYTIFALIFTGGSIVREYWKNGYNKYLGVGFIIMGFLWLIQAFGLTVFLDPFNVPFRLLYSTLFIVYSLDLGVKRQKTK